MSATIVGIVGTALGAVVGLLVGKVWDRRDERNRWLRDSQSRAYVEWVQHFQDIRLASRLVGLTDRTSADWNEHVARRTLLWSAYNATIMQLELYASPSIYAAAQSADGRLRDLSNATHAGQMTNDEWHQARQPVDQAMSVAVDHIRADLRLKPHGDRSDWITRSLPPTNHMHIWPARPD